MDKLIGDRVAAKALEFGYAMAERKAGTRFVNPEEVGVNAAKILKTMQEELESASSNNSA